LMTLDTEISYVCNQATVGTHSRVCPSTGSTHFPSMNKLEAIASATREKRAILEESHFSAGRCEDHENYFGGRNEPYLKCSHSWKN